MMRAARPGWPTMPRPSRALYIGCDSGLFRATAAADGRFELAALGLAEAGVTALLFDPDDPVRILAATRRAGVQRSDDGGRSWRERSRGVVHRDLWSLARCPATGALFVGAEPPALYRSADGGEHWTDCEALHALPESVHWTFPQPPHFAHVKHLAVHPAPPHAVYLALEEGWLVRSDDGGRGFVTLKQGVAFDAHGVLLFADEPRRVLASTGVGVYASDDRGDTFAASDRGLPERAYCSPPAASPLRPQTVYLGASELPPPFWATRPAGAASRLYRSDDGGRRWRELPFAPQTAGVRCCAVDPDDPERVAFGMSDGRVWLSDDGGASLRALADAALRGWVVALGFGPAAPPRPAADLPPASSDSSMEVPSPVPEDSSTETPSPAPADSSPPTATRRAVPGDSSPSPAISAAPHDAPATADAWPVPSDSPPAARNLALGVTVGQVYEVTIADEISRPVIGANGVCKLGDADMRLPGARKGERYRVRVLALGVNRWTGRMEATVQKLAGPL